MKKLYNLRAWFSHDEAYIGLEAHFLIYPSVFMFSFRRIQFGSSIHIMTWTQLMTIPLHIME